MNVLCKLAFLLLSLLYEAPGQNVDEKLLKYMSVTSAKHTCRLSNTKKILQTLFSRAQSTKIKGLPSDGMRLPGME